MRNEIKATLGGTYDTFAACTKNYKIRNELKVISLIFGLSCEHETHRHNYHGIMRITPGVTVLENESWPDSGVVAVTRRNDSSRIRY